jgi:hypothetical protein
MIFGGGGFNQIQVYFSLNRNLLFHPILAGSYDNHSTFISNDAIIDLPYTEDDAFIERLNACIEERRIGFIIPTHDSAALTLMENQDAIHAKVVCSCLKTTRICRYKSLTYKALEGTDILPDLYSYEEFRLPLFAKDDQGQGGRNAHLIEDSGQLYRLRSDHLNYVLCEYLPGEEMTIDCFTDRHGVNRFAQPRCRTRLLNGISARAELLPLTAEVQHIVDVISQRIRFRGYWFIQCKKDRYGKYKLMEICTRFAGTFGLSKSLDVNLPLLALCDFSEMEIEITPNMYKIVSDKTYIDRYKIDYSYERVYIDFDDTLVFHREKYNTEGMRFLYQCLNKGIDVVLITKHLYNIHETMKTIGMSESLFNKIIEVPLDRKKYEFMDDSVPSIFIDNAYAEREAVKKHLQMPTFDVSNFDCLIDWADA